MFTTCGFEKIRQLNWLRSFFSEGGFLHFELYFRFGVLVFFKGKVTHVFVVQIISIMLFYVVVLNLVLKVVWFYLSFSLRSFFVAKWWIFYNVHSFDFADKISFTIRTHYKTRLLGRLYIMLLRLAHFL